MKKFIAIIIFFILLAKPVSAHTLEENESVGAIMHITPNDNPVEDEEAGLFFEFKDPSEKFKLNLCKCTFEIYENGKIIHSQTLYQTEDKEYTGIRYIFPDPGVYKIVVKGEPKEDGAFEDFKLEYDTYVTAKNKEASTEKTIKLDIFIPILTAVIIITAAVFIIKRKKENNP